MILNTSQQNPLINQTYTYQNNTTQNNLYNNNQMTTMPDKHKTTIENEKINENVVSNSNMYIQTNVNNFTQNEINKPNKLQVNRTDYKFIETINNNNDRNNTNTVQPNCNMVQLTNNDNKNSKMQTSINKSL